MNSLIQPCNTISLNSGEKRNCDMSLEFRCEKISTSVSKWRVVIVLDCSELNSR